MPLFGDQACKLYARSFYRWESDTLVLNVLGRPNSKRDAIGRVIGHQLEVYAAAVPRRGGATAHMVQFLSGVFGVPKSAIEVVFGEKNVNKQLRIKSPLKLPAPIMPQGESGEMPVDKLR